MARPSAVRGVVALLAGALAAAAPVAAGAVRGSVDCAERCAEIVVLLEGNLPAGTGEPAAATLDQMDRTYRPPVIALRRGATLTLHNSDPELHNVHVYVDDRTVFNLAIPFAGMTIDRVFDAPGTYEVRCDVHPEMLAYLVVLPHPHFAIPDAEGRFALEGVPAGSYTLVRYDPYDGSRREQPVDVAGEAVEVAF